MSTTFNHRLTTAVVCVAFAVAITACGDGAPLRPRTGAPRPSGSRAAVDNNPRPLRQTAGDHHLHAPSTTPTTAGAAGCCGVRRLRGGAASPAPGDRRLAGVRRRLARR